MPVRSPFLVALALLTAAANPQGHNLAYPQDTWSMPSGDVAPLGSFPSMGTAEEGRWQGLIPHTHLPTIPCTFAGFSVICQTFSGPIAYRSLRVTLSSTTATALGSGFAANLPAPVPVLDRVNSTIDYHAHGWTRIAFDVPFRHDGRSSLVFEIKKEVVPIASGLAMMATAGAPPRTDLPHSVYTTGPVNSGAANAASATATTTAPLMVQLHVHGTPTIFLTSIPQATRNEFPLGGTIDFQCDAQIGSAWVGMIAGGFAARFSLPGVLGQGLVLPAVILPARGVPLPPDVVTMRIPRNPRLVGASLAWQGVVLDAARGSLVFTNGADCVIRP
jgi:hypothetical protein